MFNQEEFFVLIDSKMDIYAVRLRLTKNETTYDIIEDTINLELHNMGYTFFERRTFTKILTQEYYDLKFA